MARGPKVGKAIDDWLMMVVAITDYDLYVSFNCAPSAVWRTEPWSQFASVTLRGNALDFDWKGTTAMAITLNLDTSLTDTQRLKQLEEKPMKLVGFMDVLPERMNVSVFVPPEVFAHGARIATCGKPFRVSLLCSRIRWRKADVRSIGLSTAPEEFE